MLISFAPIAAALDFTAFKRYLAARMSLLSASLADASHRRRQHRELARMDHSMQRELYVIGVAHGRDGVCERRQPGA